VRLINADGSISDRTLAERDLMRHGGCPMVGEGNHRRYINRLAGEDSESVKTLAWGGEIGRGGGRHLESQQAPEHPQLPIYSCAPYFAEISIVAMQQQRVIEDLPNTV
jgi:hypothetical protein